MSVVEVRLRDAVYTDAKPFTTSTLDGLDDVIAAVKAWGVVDENGDDQTEIYGQFTTDGYFEIVVGMA